MTDGVETRRETEALAIRFVRVFEAIRKQFAEYQPERNRRVFKELNLNQIKALHLLKQRPGMVQKELAEALEVTPAAVSTAIRHLEKLHMIERQSDPADARHMRLFLAPDTAEMVSHMNDVWHQAIADLLGSLPVEEQRMIVEALERALANRDHSTSVEVDCD